MDYQRTQLPIYLDSWKAGEAMALQNRILKQSDAADDTLLLATANTDEPIAVMYDGKTHESGEDMSVLMVGRAKVKLGGTAVRGDKIVAGALGVGVVIPVGAGTYGVIGRTRQSGVDGDVVEITVAPEVVVVV